MIVNVRWISLVLVAGALLACGQDDRAPPAATSAGATAARCLQLTQGWVRAPMPGHAMTAAYGQLHNRCDQPVALAYLHSPGASKLELHRTEIVDGVSRMRAASQLQVPAGARLELAPGGLHLMLHGLADTVIAGSTLTLELGADAQDVLRVELPVRSMGQGGHASGH